MKKELGVNVIGYINGEFGLGEAVRLLIKGMETAKIPVSLMNFDIKTNHRHEDQTFQDFSADAPYPINLILTGPSEIPFVLTHFNSDEVFKNKYNIFYLNWESEYFPDEYVKNLVFFDEIWVPAKYCKDVISKHITKPIEIISYPLDFKSIDNEEEDEEALNFYDKSAFNFFFMFDYNSTLERKNPLNLISAFEKAFGKNDESVSLTIKTSRSNRFKQEKKSLMNRINGFKNIKIVEETFEKRVLHQIIKGCDSYVSLHRSEGFGLTMAEAMFYSKPVIATGYSGNLEFMNDKNSFLVNYKSCKVNSDIINYDRNTTWSEPDVEHAAVLMKKVRENSSEVKEIAKNANLTILENFSTAKIGNTMKNKLEIILENFEVNEVKNEFISIFCENKKLKNDLRIYKKSKLIKIIFDIKMYFRNRKK